MVPKRAVEVAYLLCNLLTTFSFESTLFPWFKLPAEVPGGQFRQTLHLQTFD